VSNSNFHASTSTPRKIIIIPLYFFIFPSLIAAEQDGFRSAGKQGFRGGGVWGNPAGAESTIFELLSTPQPPCVHYRGGGIL
jgi:hypothetical protein